ncbi:unnamed protein product [Cylicostephanus goldi]|uniref:Neurotransmitter-gated ion-channel ligand-binding domain-containing protein n=1 Tax=Cylicostephanus goldi TaxID=71465 RepID=A0A3P6THU3_CYLGO|nr:unnamed protein product [Cylicostephanus goldi]
MFWLQIASWGYGEEKVLLNASSKPFLQHYAANEEWALQEVGITQDHYDHEGTVVSEAKYIVSISRKPFYYLVSLVLPSYIICMLSVAGLFARFSTKYERQVTMQMTQLYPLFGCEFQLYYKTIMNNVLDCNSFVSVT